MKIIQVFKSADAWINPPPGIGDYIRGLCHLHEIGARLGMDVRADISSTEFARYIDQSSPIFWQGEPEAVRTAPEFFVAADHARLVAELISASRKGQENFYLSTNLGHWQRPELPESTRAFAAQFFAFTPDVSERAALGLTGPYSVLSIRCGDGFFDNPEKALNPSRRELVLRTIENHILPKATGPLVVMSDSTPFRDEVAAKFGLITTPAGSAHGARGGAKMVCRDLDLLAHSAANFHINAWREWWSGFSHYTSLIFGIPSHNSFLKRAPAPAAAG